MKAKKVTFEEDLRSAIAGCQEELKAREELFAQRRRYQNKLAAYRDRIAILDKAKEKIENSAIESIGAGTDPEVGNADLRKIRDELYDLEKWAHQIERSILPELVPKVREVEKDIARAVDLAIRDVRAKANADLQARVQAVISDADICNRAIGQLLDELKITKPTAAQQHGVRARLKPAENTALQRILITT